MMRAIIAVIALACWTCGPVCRTPCGAALVTPLPGNWTCDKLDRAERLTLAAFERDVAPLDARFAGLCSRLPGLRIVAHGYDSWMFDGRPVDGVTWCGTNGVEVGSAPILRGALPHELAHFAQRCDPDALPAHNEDDEHAGWHERRIFETVGALAEFAE